MRGLLVSTCKKSGEGRSLGLFSISMGAKNLVALANGEDCTMHCGDWSRKAQMKSCALCQTQEAAATRRFLVQSSRHRSALPALENSLDIKIYGKLSHSRLCCKNSVKRQIHEVRGQGLECGPEHPAGRHICRKTRLFF